MRRIILTLIVLITIKGYSQKGMKTEKISIFSNNISYIIKADKVDTKDKSFKITEDEMPAALYGSLWINSKKNTIEAIELGQRKIKVEKDTKTILDILTANIGKDVKISIKESEEKIEGEIRAIKGDLVIVRDVDKTTQIINNEEIKKVHINEKINEDKKLEIDSIRKELTVKFKNRGKQNLEIRYLTKNLSWAPIYELELKDSTTATLSLRAEISNDLEDIDEAKIELVAGEIDFKYSDKISNLISTAPLENAYIKKPKQYNYSGLKLSRVSAEHSNSKYTSNLNGENVQGLVYYTIEKYSLKKGGRSQNKIFSTDINYSHVYKSNITDDAINNNRYNQKQDREQGIEVFHSIKYKNNDSNTITEGSIMLIDNTKDEKKVFGQSTIYHTSKGQEEFIDINVEKDIKIVRTNITTKDTGEKKDYKNGRSYIKVFVEKDFIIKNQKAETVNIELIDNIVGKIDKQEGMEIIIKQPLLYTINDYNNVKWKYTIKPNEEKELKVKYYTYRQL